MDKYLKKYLKYKIKYFNLLNQQGGRYTIEHISMSKDDYIFDYDAKEFIMDPISLQKIPKNRAIFVNNSIYDFPYLLKLITIEQNGIAKDPIYKQIIRRTDLELMYIKVYQYAKEISNIIDLEKTEQIFFDVIINTEIQYKIKKDELVKSIYQQISSITTETELINIDTLTNLNIIDLIYLNELLKNKKILECLDSLGSTIKEDILRKPFDYMFKILLLTIEEITNLYINNFSNSSLILSLTINQIKKFLLYDKQKQLYILNNILILTKNQINKFLSYDDIKQNSILNFNKDEMDTILLIEEISVENEFLNLNSDHQSFLIKMYKKFGYESFKKLVQLSQDDEIRIIKCKKKEK